MRLLLLSTQAERRAFGERLAYARAGKGRGFSEAPESVLGDIHLNYGQVWGLFDETGPEPEEMLGGFIIHNLAMFPQSYSRPDLTYLPPETVWECGELWALAPGAARLARHAGFILAGLRKARAILVYVAFKPRNTTRFYKTFSAVGDAIPWHYVQSLDGTEHWAQAMVLEGLALEMTAQVAAAVSYESFDGQCLQFRNPFPIAPRIGRGIPRRQPSVDRVGGGNRVSQIQIRR